MVRILAPLRKEAGKDPKGNVLPTTSKTPVSGYSRAKKRLDEEMEAVARKDVGLPEDDDHYRKTLSLDAGAPLPQNGSYTTCGAPPPLAPLAWRGSKSRHTSPTKSSITRPARSAALRPSKQVRLPRRGPARAGTLDAICHGAAVAEEDQEQRGRVPGMMERASSATCSVS